MKILTYAGVLLAFSICADAQIFGGTVPITKLRKGSVTCLTGQTMIYNQVTSQFDSCATGGGGGGGGGGGAATSILPILLAALPATCAIGDIRYVTDATISTGGQRIYDCVALNTWAQRSTASDDNTILVTSTVEGQTNLRLNPAAVTGNLISQQNTLAAVSLSATYATVFTASVTGGLSAGGCMAMRFGMVQSSAFGVTVRVTVGGASQAFNTGGATGIWDFPQIYVCNAPASQVSQSLILAGPLQYATNSFFELLASSGRVATLAGSTASTFTVSIEALGTSGQTATPVYFVLSKI